MFLENNLVSPPSLEHYSQQERAVVPEVRNHEPTFLSVFTAYFLPLKLILKFFEF